MANSGKINKGEVRNPYGRAGKPKTNAAGDSSLVPRQRLANLAGKHFGGERDLYEVMGYPRHLAVEDYVDIYIRQDIAGRIVDAYPDATWREQPTLECEPETLKAAESIIKKMSLFRALHRLDRLMNMGHYGVLVLGLDGGEPMWKPANGTDYNLLYLQPHSERTAQVTKWEDDPQSPRYGQPVTYRVTTGVNWTGSGAGQKTVNVHHSRVIHVAERALEDVSIGTPRLERIYNRMMDLDKLLGGSAEMYWQNVAMIMAFLADADVEWQPGEAEEMASHLEEMQHGLRRSLRLRGVTPENLAPGLQGASPGEHIDKQIDIIAGASGIPKRILLGNEAGELASSQDETAWQGRIAERREQWATPDVLNPLFAKLSRFGVIPSSPIEVVWPESDTLGEKGRAEVADLVSRAIQQYNNTMGAEQLVTPDEFRQILGYEELPAVEEDELPEDDEQVREQFRGERQ